MIPGRAALIPILALSILGAPLAVKVQPKGKVPVISILGGDPASPL